ncbi:NAD-dependent epimerase/dehydratase family protein [Streptantibioticus silvisoli]|uniref:NAD(P)-dependent oxidoreductase n=1 Tax=Streptantibioticus silvisoli TaxID=2705255 RepID=A0ABT6W2R0_9ACTN|nr:NAD(P)-dependent oxidoreductase [Streptantibioticus silvisoli]MDI5963786.1 NAD(P)-dependent oxidoreductase [Streptantibioticus silvisoli]
MSRILITGAVGGVGTILRPQLAAPGRTLRLLDIAPLADLPAIPAAAAGRTADGEEYVQASVTDAAAMEKACEGVDAIIHLGGISVEAPWERIHEVNIGGTCTVFEAARRTGVPRVVFASSNHVVGFHTPDEYPLPETVTPLPDTYYGVSKVAGEALGALYAHRYGLDVICVRIMSCFPEPANPRMLATWLSPDDAGRLFEACLTAEKPGYRVVYGVSDNTRGGWVSQEGARALGFEPRDNAEAYASQVRERAGEVADDDPVLAHLGGQFCFPNLDADRLGA